jgi:hypothetical protein
MLTIVSANFGGYDTPKEHVEQTVPCQFVTVTEDERFETLHPRRAAKRPKMFPWEYADTPVTVWIDGSFRIKSPHFAAMCLATLRTGTDLAMWDHPWRTCIYDELHASAQMKKYKGEPMQEQVAAYEAEGHPRHWGLWAAGVILRRDTPVNRDLSWAWWDEIEKWSHQDQLSLPVVLRRHAVRPSSLTEDIFHNTWLEWVNHTRDD